MALKSGPAPHTSEVLTSPTDDLAIRIEFAPKNAVLIQVSPQAKSGDNFNDAPAQSNDPNDRTSLSPSHFGPHQVYGAVDASSLPTSESNSTVSSSESEATDTDSTPLLMESHTSLSTLESNGSEHCHPPVNTHEEARISRTRAAKKRLIIASCCCVAFAAAEGLAGYFSGSYAIMSDAAHMLSDFANLIISLLAITLGGKPAKKGFNYGWIRAEVLGALTSVLLIWQMAFWILYECVQRLRYGDFELESVPMLVAGVAALVFNIFMFFLLRGTGHGHSHGGGGVERRPQTNSTGHTRFDNEVEEPPVNNGASLNGIAEQPQATSPENLARSFFRHINIQAALAHVIGDIAMSGGVFVVSIIIFFVPDWKILDPICSIALCLVVVLTTVKVFRNTVNILMEGFPSKLDYEKILDDLQGIQGVKRVHDLKVWGLTMDKNVMTVHLVVENDREKELILQEALKLVRVNHNIDMATVQIENLKMDVMDHCVPCQPIR